MAEVRPRVFLSFASDDADRALRFSRGLARAGLHPWVYNQDIQPGQNFVDAIERALAECDYYTLLWSEAAVDSWWVTQEWTTALAREGDERRSSFFFVVCLDQTPPPRLLRTRRYLDTLGDGLDPAVTNLASALLHDWTARGNGACQTSPPPTPVHADAASCPTLTLRVRNRALSIGLVLSVPECWTGQDLEDRVRAELELRDDQTMKIAGSTVQLRFHYQLEYQREQRRERIPPDARLADLLTDGADVCLVVRKEEQLPTGESRTIEYLGPSGSGIPPYIVNQLFFDAFGHLLPR